MDPPPAIKNRKNPTTHPAPATSEKINDPIHSLAKISPKRKRKNANANAKRSVPVMKRNSNRDHAKGGKIPARKIAPAHKPQTELLPPSKKSLKRSLNGK